MCDKLVPPMKATQGEGDSLLLTGAYSSLPLCDCEESCCFNLPLGLMVQMLTSVQNGSAQDDRSAGHSWFGSR